MTNLEQRTLPFAYRNSKFGISRSSRFTLSSVKEHPLSKN
jgi:hypothetical protein